MNACRVCKESEAKLPEGAEIPRYCSKCWETRLRQLFLEEDRFHIQRVYRTAEAEKYLVYHTELDAGATAVGCIIALHEHVADHLEISSYLYDRMDWHTAVPFIYEQGVEGEVELLDIFLGVLETELIPSWGTATWTVEVSLCTGDPFWIDSRDREEVDQDDESA